ncbi:efflux RND transporter permease subunit [Mucilaginibacter rubeus]|uniref:Efflux RND transporter permease subunit n=1 Tax=Mucilaginibacter rubeus TaxID=2027860 RepID=A0AAE6MI21_9SPHI|nr:MULTISPECIES: efflux RND transporter permease subunit [Mucilaginibacter]QEM04176.1 efflux RND transporter permease subunit [Mucilaginibacter rubeus]QEM16779.1 efflux RND transporter permease subunit [Mucilaginibacter gossypii]QTE46744.1 efflux RND transporter permease subunit [Mucilaginibacter rubeus]QTE53341.1 efflux RND transporter permease subunit [Mucilaginibacter rubeus]QTE58427.1 efflux RND transporter permease subunit [Mucilaginibacter rubeus]
MKDVKKEFGPSSWAIDNKTAIYVLMFLITALGLISYNRLPKENFPDIAQSKVFITTQFNGQSPQNIENLVTRQIEKQLKSLKGLKKVTSNSVQNVSIITAEFQANIDIKDAKIDVKDAIDKAKKDLPQNDNNYTDPAVSDINVADLPILYINISGNYDLKKLKEYADILKDEIESYKEISRVDEVGALTPEIQVNVDMNKMAAAQLSLTDITTAVGNENILLSAGTVKTDGVRRTIDIKKDFKNAEEVAAMVIRNPKGQSVYLRDIADVKDSFLEQESYARLKTNDNANFKNVITLNVSKRAGENLIEASDKINALIKLKQKTVFPKGLDIVVTGDQSDKTRTTLNDLINTIVIGFLLVTVILMFFMGTTNAIFVALSVPLSCFIAFLVMPAIGFTLNMIVLFSFLLALGIVVDDAIVVIENTHRIFANGKVPIKEAAKMAAGEVFLPVFSGTMTTLAPFIPLAFWNSLIGHFMFFLPITLIITLLASLVVAYIINPVFAVDFMKPHHDGEHDNPKFDRPTKRAMIFLAIATVIGYLINVGFGNLMVLIMVLYLINHFFLLRIIDRFQKNAWPRFQNWYAKWLERAVRRPITVLVGTIGLFIFAIVLMAVRGKTPEFFPSGDPNFAYVYITLPIGTDQAYTNEITKSVEKKVAEIVEPDKDIVSSVISNVTKGVTDPTDEDQGDYENKGKVTVAFVEFGKRNGKDTKKVLANIRAAVQGIPGAKISVTQENSGPPVQKDISIEIVGDNLDTLVATGNRLKSYLSKQNIAGIENLIADVQSDKPEIVFDIDRERANREGLSTYQITQNLITSVFGWKAGDFRNTKEDDYKIMVRTLQNQRGNIDEIKNLKITYRDMAMNGAIRQVPISAFADVRYTTTYSNIKRKQQRRVLTLGSNVIKPNNPNEVNANILKAINNFKKPDNVIIRQGGGQEDQMEAMTFLLSALGVSFGLILIILMIQFNSIGKTLIIISEILFSIIGVLLGVTIFGMTMSIVMTGIGIIALAGVVVRNGILLVEFTDMLLEQGVSIHDAVVEAGHTRMTPVLLTATAAILGLIPLAVGFNIDFVGLFTHFEPHIHFGGDNVAFWGPLAWTMIFGLGFATIITLILVPCLYLIRYNLKARLFGKKSVEAKHVEVLETEAV